MLSSTIRRCGDSSCAVLMWACIAVARLRVVWKILMPAADRASSCLNPSCIREINGVAFSKRQAHRVTYEPEPGA